MRTQKVKRGDRRRMAEPTEIVRILPFRTMEEIFEHVTFRREVSGGSNKFLEEIPRTSLIFFFNNYRRLLTKLLMHAKRIMKLQELIHKIGGFLVTDKYIELCERNDYVYTHKLLLGAYNIQRKKTQPLNDTYITIFYLENGKRLVYPYYIRGTDQLRTNLTSSENRYYMENYRTSNVLLLADGFWFTNEIIVNLNRNDEHTNRILLKMLRIIMNIVIFFESKISDSVLLKPLYFEIKTLHLRTDILGSEYLDNNFWQYFGDKIIPVPQIKAINDINFTEIYTGDIETSVSNYIDFIKTVSSRDLFDELEYFFNTTLISSESSQLNFKNIARIYSPEHLNIYLNELYDIMTVL